MVISKHLIISIMTGKIAKKQPYFHGMIRTIQFLLLMEDVKSRKKLPDVSVGGYD